MQSSKLMKKYKAVIPKIESQEIEQEAKSGDKFRKFICEKLGIVISKIQPSTESEVNPDTSEDDIDEALYYQRSSRYNGWKIGNSKTSMQNYGCGVMCFGFVTRKDPKDIDDIFINNGVYMDSDGIKDSYEGDDDLINFEKACAVLGLKNYKKDENINDMPTQEETIKQVWLGSSKHFVVRLNKNGERSIFDPWTGKYQSINLYPFINYRIFDK